MIEKTYKKERIVSRKLTTLVVGFNEVKTLGNKDEGGHGSTGMN